MARRCHHDVLLPRNRYTGSEAAEIVVLNIFQRADESVECITVPPNSVDVQELLGLGVHQRASICLVCSRWDDDSFGTITQPRALV